MQPTYQQVHNSPEVMQPGAFRHADTVIAEQTMTASEVMEAANLNWDVEGRPVYDQSGNIIPGHQAVTRTDTDATLSIMRNSYRPVTNTEAFGFLDEMLNGDVQFTQAGALHGGRRVWLEARLPRDIYLGGDMDEAIDPVIYFGNSHDGSLAVSMWITPTRIACSNALNYSLRTAARSWKHKHTRNVMQQQRTATEVLALANRYYDLMQQEANDLLARQFSVQDAHRALSHIIPFSVDGETVISVTGDEVPDGRSKTMVLNKRDDIMQHWNADDAQNIIGTAWGFVQTVTAWETHTRTAKNADARMDRLTFTDSGLATAARDYVYATA